MTTLSDKAKMDDRTRKALEESIAKWERNAVAETPADVLIGSDSCALCHAFLIPSGSCDDCPVRRATGVGGCLNTPYWEATFKLDGWLYGGGSGEGCRAAAREEVAFLKSLLPQDDEP